MKTIKTYVVRRSGLPYEFNLDSVSLDSLADIESLYKEKGINCSQSVIIRRAIRKHREYLVTCPDEFIESIEIKRAAKGVQ